MSSRSPESTNFRAAVVWVTGSATRPSRASRAPAVSAVAENGANFAAGPKSASVPLVTRIAIGASPSVPSTRTVSGLPAGALAYASFRRMSASTRRPAGPRIRHVPPSRRASIDEPASSSVSVLPRPSTCTRSASTRASRSSARRMVRSIAPRSTFSAPIASASSGTPLRRSSATVPATGTPAKNALKVEGTIRPPRRRSATPAFVSSPRANTTRSRPTPMSALARSMPCGRIGTSIVPVVVRRRRGGEQALQLRHVDERTPDCGGDDRLLAGADAGAVRVDHDLAPSELELQVFEMPFVALDARVALDRDRRVRARRGAEPAREVAGATAVEAERQVRAARRFRTGEDARKRERCARAADLEIDRRARGPEHSRDVAAAQLRGHSLAGERPAPGTAELLAARDRDVECVERELDRPPARHVAVAQLRPCDRELQLEVARERPERCAAAVELELETPQRTVDAREAGE